MAIWAQAHRFDPSYGSPISWLATIVRNRAIDRLRKRRTAGIQVVLEDWVEIADDRPDPFAMAASESDAQRLHRFLEVLDARTQRFIARTFFEGLRYDDLAREEGLPLGTVKTVIRRGLLRMRAEWERDEIDRRV